MVSVIGSTDSQDAVIDSNGQARISWNQQQVIILSQIAIRSDSTRQTLCTLYRNGNKNTPTGVPAGARVVASTQSGNLATCQGEPALQLLNGEEIHLCWSNGEPGSKVYADFHFMVVS